MEKLLKFLSIVLIGVALVSCGEDEVEQRQSTFFLYRVGSTPINGVVTFTETAPGTVEVDIALQNTNEGLPFPAHLHFGTIGETGELAFRLNDVDGETGRSITILDKERLENGEIFTYDFLETMNGSVKIHLNDSFFRNIAVASGNIGTNSNSISDAVAVCTGH